MDLSVSPDVEAYLCYGLVFVLGAFAAVAQIFKRLGGIEGIWFVPRTWLLFLMYVAVPIGLFWLLDRTGAITDTSFFAAVLVGVGYERIIAGGNQAVHAPGEVSQFWTPFLAYADRVERLVRERAERRQKRLVERVVNAIVEDRDRFQALENLAMNFAPDAAVLGKRLATFDANRDVVGETGVLEQKVRVLYGVLLSEPDIHYLMKTRNIIDNRLYWLEVKRIKSIVSSAFVIVLVIVVFIAALQSIKPNVRNGLATYHIWRIAKTNATSVDQFRSRQKLIELMRQPAVKENATQQLTSLLRRPGLPIERIELILQTLLESRMAVGGNSDVGPLLVQALRSNSVDTRMRINDVLKHLAQACSAKLDEAISAWKPSEGDSTTALEEKIDKWAAYWVTCKHGVAEAARLALSMLE